MRMRLTPARRSPQLSERRDTHPNIPLIPGTSSVAHLRENLAAAELDLPVHAFKELDGMATIGVA
jgi:aryl-alcohol dehydrogenase-like predicted oxidoreductase